MMDILYTIGNFSNWRNYELKYSLRSIEKNCKNVGRVFIVGVCPDFIDKKKVVFIPCEDDQACKHMNLMKKIETAVENGIGENFLWSSDDHFYVQPTDFANYPFYRKCALPTDAEGNAYHRSLYYTQLVLSAAGLPTHNFSWHGNTHFNKTLFCEPQFEAIRKLSYTMETGCEPSALMLNYWLYRKPFKITERKDCKCGPDISREQLLELIKGRECISCASDTPQQLKIWLAKNFPDKSKYEL